jgi:glycosyltransferase involved in cell wall biosynthesis
LKESDLNSLEQTLYDWNIDKSVSFFIGDTYEDMEIASGIGCGGVIVPGDLPELELLSGRKVSGNNIDFVSRDFISASRWVLANSLPMSDVSIIIPAKNEEHNLPHILPYLPASSEIILVDGRSTDNTVKITRGLRPDAVVLNQESNGKGNALKMGFNRATREYLITFDADGSFSPCEVYRLMRKLREGYDMVKGSRFMSGGGTMDMPINRIVGNHALTALANVLYGSHYSDLVYGFHAFRRDGLKSLLLQSEGFEMDAELYLRASRMGLRVAELPSFESRRLYGRSRLNSIQDGGRIFRTILRERFRE